MTTYIQSFSDIYQKLDKVGFSKSFIQNTIFPSYWKTATNDLLSDNDDALLQTSIYLSKHLNIDVESIINKDQDIKFNIPVSCFKIDNRTNKEKILKSGAIVSSIANYIAYSSTTQYKGLPNDGKEIRNFILNTKQQPNVNLYNLIDFCWEIGIPVIFLEALPKEFGKMNGMCFFSDNRPSIILTKTKTKSAWYIFTLAHELGHIINNHINEETTALIDEKVLLNYSDRDEKEIEANNTALEIITGYSKITYTKQGMINGKNLAEKAKIAGDENRIDPGFLTLNYAFNLYSLEYKTFAVAQNALNALGDKNLDIDYFNNKISHNIDTSILPEESLEFIKKFINI